MSRTALPTPTTVTRSGVTPVTPTAMDATNGNSLINDGATYFDVTNTDTASHTLTIGVTQQVDGQAVPGIVKTIAAGATKRYADFPVKIYGAVMQLNADSALVKIASYRNA